MSEWKPAKLGDIAEMCLGKMLDKEKNKGVLQPYLANLNVRWGGFELSNLSTMRFEESESERYGLRSGDLVICEGGEPGRCAIWRDEVPEMKIQKAIHRLRTNKNYSNEFVYYHFLLACRNGELAKHFNGSTIKHLTGYSLKQVEFKFPPLAAQNRIAAVLSALDAKIALNHRINVELEGMAKLLYDYWFVQYDFPLSAAQAAALGQPRLTGQPYRTSGGPMVFDPQLKREIPKGWKVKTIEAILAKEAPSKKIPASEILKSGSIPVIDQSKDFICGFTNDEDALICVTPKIIFGDHTRILKFINFDFARGADGTQMIASNSESMPPHLFYHSLLKIDLSSYGYARHFKFLKQSNITLPDSSIAQRFEEIVASHYELIRANTFQNQELTTLRDWLLPMLMNGQVRVG